MIIEGKRMQRALLKSGRLTLHSTLSTGIDWERLYRLMCWLVGVEAAVLLALVQSYGQAECPVCCSSRYVSAQATVCSKLTKDGKSERVW